MISADQVRAARGLLGWDLDELGRKCGVTGTNIGYFEGHEHLIAKETIDKVVIAFALAGVQFIDGGIEYSIKPLVKFKSKDWTVVVTEDVEHWLRENPEENNTYTLICGDEDKHSTTASNALRVLEDKGLVQRVFLKEGQTGSHVLDHTRIVPDSFIPQGCVLQSYADKIVIVEKLIAGAGHESDDDKDQVTVYQQPELARLITDMTNILWDELPAACAENAVAVLEAKKRRAAAKEK